MLKFFASSEKKLAGVILGVLAIVAFGFVFGPNIYAQFARQTGDTGWGYGYGYGYGYGGGFDGGTIAGYRTGGDEDPTVYEYDYGYGYIASGVTFDADNGYEVTPGNLGSLVESGVMVPNGGNIASTTELTFTDKVTMTVGAGTTVTIPSGTTFTADEAGDFSELASDTVVSTVGLTNLTVAGAIDFGLPDLGLTVDPAITISVYFGSGYEGTTLRIYRRDAGSTTWTASATGTSATCVVTAGYCNFTTTHLSSFAMITGAAASSSTTSGSNGGSGGVSYIPPASSSSSSTDATVVGTYVASTATANNPTFNASKGLVAPISGTTNCTSGSLIKGSMAAVYYCGADGKRYVFVNDKAYFSWYANFSGVQKISDATLATIMIGGNITYRPGVKMIKIVSDPKVYAVARGGVLRWIGSEAIANRLYGSNWNKMIDDVADSFFVNYSVGTPISQ